VALRDLTDRSAVLQAINEARELGEAAFLEKYGFERSDGFRLHTRTRPFHRRPCLARPTAFSSPKSARSDRPISAEAA